MRSGAVDQEPGRGPTRLVPQADGYADYVDPTREPSRPTGPGQHRSQARRAPGQGPTRSIPTGSIHIRGVPSSAARRGTQRPIRTTITWLLILPLITMIALYAYAAYSTIGPVEAKQHSAAVSIDVDQPATLVAEALQAEQADTFIYQASDHLALPDSKLTAPGTGAYAQTDAAIAAYEAGTKKAQGDLPATAKQASAVLLSALNTRLKLRAEAQSGSLNGLAVFQSYLAISQSFLGSFVNLTNPDETIQMYYQGDGTLDGGSATDDLGEAAALLEGVMAGGGYMSPQEYQLFDQLYNEQQQDFTLIKQPVYWQVSPDPYWTSVDGNPAAMGTPQVKAALDLEQEVLADGSNRATVRLPIPLRQVQDSIGAVIAPSSPLLTAKDIAQLGQTATDNHQGDEIEERLAAVGVGGLLVVILALLLLLRFGARISRELTALRNAAQVLSGERLPSVVRRLRAGDDVDVEAEAPALNLKTRTREVTETADAFSAVQHTAIEAAVEQATLRKGVSNVFRSLARRNQSLVQRQLRMLDEMERGTQDPDVLAQLFRLDHLTTRMRRQAEGLIILSGSAPSRRWRQPVAVVEVLRGAISEIEDYVRVDLVTDSPDYLAGAPVADVTHLLAELIENAVVYSPPATRVAVRGGRVANGYVIEVEDRGLGIPTAARDALNERLAQPPDFDLTDSDQLGLFVVSRLAIRNGIKVSLRESGFGGTTAIVLLPGPLVVTEDEAKVLAAQGPQGPLGPQGPQGPLGAIGAGNRPTEADGPSVTSRRVPRLDRPVDRPATAAHDYHDLGDGFGSGTSGTGSYGGGPVGSGQYGAGAPGSGQSFGGGSLPSRGEPVGTGSFGGGTFPTGGGSSFGRGQAPGGDSFGGGSFNSRSSAGGPGGSSSPDGGTFGTGASRAVVARHRMAPSGVGQCRPVAAAGAVRSVTRHHSRTPPPLARSRRSATGAAAATGLARMGCRSGRKWPALPRNCARIASRHPRAPSPGAHLSRPAHSCRPSSVACGPGVTPGPREIPAPGASPVAGTRLAPGTPAAAVTAPTTGRRDERRLCART